MSSCRTKRSARLIWGFRREGSCGIAVSERHEAMTSDSVLKDKVILAVEGFFSQRFGSHWEDEDRFLKEFMEELKMAP